MEFIRGLIPEKLRKFLPKNQGGNLVSGENTVQQEGGKVEDNVLVGKNSVTSKAKPGQTTSIRGNWSIGKNRIIITTEPDEEDE